MRVRIAMAAPAVLVGVLYVLRPAAVSGQSATPARPPCPPGTVLVPGGTVSLGAAQDADALAPGARSMTAFCIDRTEVTVARYRTCVSSGGCPPPEATISFPGYGPPEPMRGELSRFCNVTRADRADHPMNCVDEPTAAAFCAWEGGRLPDEAEWELAARGPDASRYPWGASTPKDELCWDRRVTGQGTCAVGSFPRGASATGALDMAGNVWEWTASRVADGPGGSARNVVRGGGWTNLLPRLVSATYRWPVTPMTRLNCLGFRCVRSPAPS